MDERLVGSSLEAGAIGKSVVTVSEWSCSGTMAEAIPLHG
jgi:hypothetical protein